MLAPIGTVATVGEVVFEVSAVAIANYNGNEELIFIEFKGVDFKRFETRAVLLSATKVVAWLSRFWPTRAKRAALTFPLDYFGIASQKPLF